MCHLAVRSYEFAVKERICEKWPIPSATFCMDKGSDPELMLELAFNTEKDRKKFLDAVAFDGYSSGGSWPLANYSKANPP